MKARTKYVLYLVFVHALLAAFSIPLLSRGPEYFIAAEALLLISLVWSVWLYRGLIHPVNVIVAGTEMLKEQDFSSRLRSTGSPEADALIGVYNSMFDQLSAERTRQAEQNYFLEKLIRDSPAGIIVLDFDGRIVSVNPAAAVFFKMPPESLLGQSMEDFKTPLLHEASLLSDGETRVITVTGSQLYRCRRAHFMDRGFARTFFMIEEMTKEVMQTERKAYEKVIRMMSHEVNNSIGAVNSFMESFRRYAAQLTEADRTDFGEAIDIAIERNKRLGSFMTNFSDVIKIPQPRKQPCDVTGILHDMRTIFSAECEQRRIAWVFDLCAEEFTVDIDPHQFEHVLSNVFKNAIEAIGQDGTITLVTTTSPICTLVIRDTGKGISPHEKANLFTPFFSSKPHGQGIGLTVVREILLNHNYSFSLAAAADGCTEFTIEFR